MPDGKTQFRSAVVEGATSGLIGCRASGILEHFTLGDY